MKMLLLVFRSSMENDVLRLLKEEEVTAFTAIPTVLGSGETGKAFGIGEAGHSAHNPAWPGSNCMIVAEMSDGEADTVIKELQAFRDHLAQLQGGAKVPLRVLVLPCERVL